MSRRRTTAAAPKQVTAPASSPASPIAPAASTTTLRPGDEAIVIDGDSKGRRGLIQGEGISCGDIPALRIEFTDRGFLQVSHIRVDFLRRAS